MCSFWFSRFSIRRVVVNKPKIHTHIRLKQNNSTEQSCYKKVATKLRVDDLIIVVAVVVYLMSTINIFNVIMVAPTSQTAMISMEVETVIKLSSLHSIYHSFIHSFIHSFCKHRYFYVVRNIRYNAITAM